MGSATILLTWQKWNTLLFAARNAGWIPQNILNWKNPLRIHIFCAQMQILHFSIPNREEIRLQNTL